MLWIVAAQESRKRAPPSLGTSAEAGDSGEVGRGNRVCGVISLRTAGQCRSGSRVESIGSMCN